jgi:outer membrane protein
VKRLPFALALAAPFACFAQIPEDLILLGAALRSRPAYDGSASQRAELVPVVRYYGRPWFARTTQGILEGGARVEPLPGLALGAQIAYEGGRRTSESEFLRQHDLPDIRPGASFGVHLEWDSRIGPMPVTLLLRGRQHADSARGAQVDLRATAGVFQHGGFTAGIFAQGTWANAKAAQSFYGITPQQTATSGLPAFDAGGGALFTSVGLLWSAEVSKDWMAVGSAERRELRGDAARSPLAERSWNFYAGAGLAYRF